MQKDVGRRIRGSPLNLNQGVEYMTDVSPNLDSYQYVEEMQKEIIHFGV